MANKGQESLTQAETTDYVAEGHRYDREEGGATKPEQTVAAAEAGELTEKQKEELRYRIRGILKNGEKIPYPAGRLGEDYKDREKEVYGIVREESNSFNKQGEVMQLRQKQLNIFSKRVRELFEEIKQDILEEIRSCDRKKCFEDFGKKIAGSIDKKIGDKDGGHYHSQLSSSLRDALENSKNLEEFRKRLRGELEKLHFWAFRNKRKIKDILTEELSESFAGKKLDYFEAKEWAKQAGNDNKNVNLSLDTAIKECRNILQEEVPAKMREISEQVGFEDKLIPTLDQAAFQMWDEIMSESEMNKKFEPREYDLKQKYKKKAIIIRNRLNETSTKIGDDQN